MATFGDPPVTGRVDFYYPFQQQQHNYCPCCGKPYGYTYTISDTTAPLTFSKERIERWLIDCGLDDGGEVEAMRTEEV